MVSVFAIVKVYEIELKAAYSHISNSAEAKRAGTSADGNPVPAKVAKPSKPAYMEDKRLYKCLCIAARRNHCYQKSKGNVL